MKFQNPIFNFFERTEAGTGGQAETKLLPIFQSWGHNKLSGYLPRRQNLSSRTMILTHKVFVEVERRREKSNL